MAPDRPDVGSRLRAAREARGISLRDIAASTKISVSALEALERNDTSRLPGGLFSRAFVRAYAKEVGLDPDEAARDFVERFSPDADTASGERPTRARTATPGDGASRATVGWLGLAITLMLVAVWIGVDRYYSRHAEAPANAGRPTSAETPPRPPAPPPMPKPEVPKPAVPAAQPEAGVAGPAGQAPPQKAAEAVQPMPAPSGQPEAVPAAPTATASPGPPASPADAALPLRFVLVPRSDCWVSLSLDGKRIPGRVVKAGEKLDLSAGQSIVLTVGDAGALDYTINDAPGRALGSAGQVATVVITTTNYKTFLAARAPQ